MTRVKICGITSYEDAALALDNGADALGFNFYRHSPRYIPPERARCIIARLPALSVTVGVFVNETETTLRAIARQASVGVLQLHGDENPEYCARLGEWPVIKVVRVGATFVADTLTAFRVRAFLLDACVASAFGGTGRSFDWALAREVAPYGPVIMAGGLTPDNVAAAIATVQPYGVDVCSGVESAPGKKDPRRVREFMQEVSKCE